MAVQYAPLAALVKGDTSSPPVRAGRIKAPSGCSGVTYCVCGGR